MLVVNLFYNLVVPVFMAVYLRLDPLPLLTRWRAAGYDHSIKTFYDELIDTRSTV